MADTIQTKEALRMELVALGKELHRVHRGLNLLLAEIDRLVAEGWRHYELEDCADTLRKELN